MKGIEMEDREMKECEYYKKDAGCWNNGQYKEYIGGRDNISGQYYCKNYVNCVFKLKKQAKALKEENEGLKRDYKLLKSKFDIVCDAGMAIKIDNDKLEEALEIAEEAISEMVNKTCENGCRFNDKDCTPANCIIREWKDLATTTLQRIREV